MPTANNYYIDKALTNVSIRFTNPSYISDILFPRLAVKNKTGIYYEYDKSNLRAENDERAPGTEANEINYELIQRSYGPLIDHALKAKITDEEVEQSDAALQPFVDATDAVTEKIWLSKEIDAANKLAAITQGINLAAGQQWSDYSNSDPISDIQLGVDTVKGASLRVPNILVMGYQVYVKLIHHPDLLGLLPVTQTRMMNLQKLAEIFGVDQIVVGDAQKNTAIQGATDALQYVWGKSAYLLYAEQNPGLRKMSSTYTLELTNGVEVGRWYEQPIRSTFVEVRRFYEQKITNASAVYKFATAVA